MDARSTLGRSDGRSHRVCCGGIELYGTLTVGPTAPEWARAWAVGISPPGGGGSGGSGDSTSGAPPDTIMVSGARTNEGHGDWPNDRWRLAGSASGRPQWSRQGNPRNYIRWDGRRWTLNGMQPACYFQHAMDTPLPPKSGWSPGEMGVSSMPILSYEDAPREVPVRPELPVGFAFHVGYGEATRADQIGHIASGGIEGHCFSGDKFSWPLQWAAMIGDVAAINALAAHGHDPNVKMTNWFDSVPLGWAASFGQCKAIEALIAAGADPRCPANSAGNTPLKDAQRERHSKAVALLNEYLSGKRPIGVAASATAAAL